jgi:hypothetical protein
MERLSRIGCAGDYLSALDSLNTKQYIDNTDCFIKLIKHKYTTLDNCRGSGISLFLKILACFLDETIETKDLFRNLKIGKREEFDDLVNSYRVLWMDFSDFNATSFDMAMAYIKEKMSHLYKFYYDYFDTTDLRYYEYRSLEYVLNIIERRSSLEDLQRSLRKLIQRLKGYKSRNDKVKLAILIDNMVAIETISIENGYSSDMEKFLEYFVIDDVYNYCDLFIQVVNQADNYRSWPLSNRYLSYYGFCVFSSDLHVIFPELYIPENEQIFLSNLTISPKEMDWNTIINQTREKIKQMKFEEEQRHLQMIRNEKARFAVELSPNVPILSINMGIRSKKLDKHSPKYKYLTNLLKLIYVHLKPDFHSDNVYHHIINIENDKLVIKNTYSFEDCLRNLPNGNMNWKRDHVQSDYAYWVQSIYTHNGPNSISTPAKPDNIKVYACFCHCEIQEIYLDSLRHLLKHANNTFAAKIAIRNRSDQMCYWLSIDDFKYLEDFYSQYTTDMKRSLPFVAYKRMLGISKDFPGADPSHNSLMANIISDYLKTVKRLEDIELENMYNNYISKWNADIYEESYYSSFKDNSALSLVVILDSLDTILNHDDITEHSTLLSDNREFWYTLSNSCCWADVNERWPK